MYGLSGTLLNWISSYLSERCQLVSIQGHKSEIGRLAFGVPQGSVLGPLLFTSYISPVSSLVSSYGLNQQQYADDTQVYLSLSKINPSLSITSLTDCLTRLRCWFAENGLTINPSKSEVMLLSTPQRCKSLHQGGLTSVSIAGTNIKFSDKITTLGLTLDKSLTFSNHVQTVCRSAMFHLRALKHIRPLLNQNDAATIATSLINSRLDYLNSILHDTSTANITFLQRIQNAAARVVLYPNHIQPSDQSLFKLHWLPVKYRIQYKIASLTHSAIQSKQPSYLAQLLQPYTPSRTLRSSNQSLLIVPRTHLRLTDQSFCNS